MCSDAWGGLGVSGGGILAGEGVHGPQELVGDAAGLPQSAQQRPMHRCRVIPNRVFSGKEETRNRLQHTHTSISMCTALKSPVKMRAAQCIIC